MCLETFWRNARWSLLFPHVPSDFDPSKNRDAHRDAVFRGLGKGLVLGSRHGQQASVSL
jgi:hypothetical protein